ncbi:MAG: hypothetical protein KGJ95_08000 [Candidatus Omnitrophica bacterium]|nr:hypothetical protein [Candidatus Omnitrophota bacterium]MDE2231986.1 hypothetical protein [Candidatus Omnitrophota bacterium]
MKEINSQNCIVVFLDVLGYRDWVKNAESGDYFYNAFKEALENIEKIKGQFVLAQQDFQCIDITIWSDALIFIVDLDQAYQEKSAVVGRFFYFLAFLIIEFLAKTGYFLRGGISYGDFLQKKILGEDNRFIFSKAFISAVELERKAHNPRILMDRKFVEFGRSQKLFDQVIDSTIREDIYKQHCFDYYFYLEYLHNPARPYPEVQLRRIKDQLVRKFPEIAKMNKEDVENKYRYFFHYHNTHVYSLFEPQFREEDFSDLKMGKADVIRPLIQLGMVEEDESFAFKRDIRPNIPQIMARFGQEKFNGQAVRLAEIIKTRIEESNKKIEECSIAI